MSAQGSSKLDGQADATWVRDTPADLDDLRRASVRLGADPLLIQGPGGNTSVKQGEAMWIKASGTLLADATDRSIFVEVDLPRLNEAIERGDPKADQAEEFARVPGGLRPSIETSLHAVFPHRIVLACPLRQYDRARCAGGRARAACRAAGRIRLGFCSLRQAWSQACRANAHGAKPNDRRDRARQPRPDRRRRERRGGGRAAGRGRRPYCTPRPRPAPRPISRGSALVARRELCAGALWITPARRRAARRRVWRPRRGGSLYPDHVIFCGVGSHAR